MANAIGTSKAELQQIVEKLLSRVKDGQRWQIGVEQTIREAVDARYNGGYKLHEPDELKITLSILLPSSIPLPPKS
jgi:hypothetical protein